MKPDSKSVFTLRGGGVPADLVGNLRPADTGSDLNEQLRQDGYLLLRDAHNPEAVNSARAEVLRRLADVSEVREPAEDGIASGLSTRREMYPTTEQLGAFWQSVSEGKALRSVVNGQPITQLMSQIFQEPASHFSFAWLRAMTPGRASPLHIDHPYMNRGSQRLLTVWSPLCLITKNDGPLYILEGSHKWPEIRAQFEGHDVDRDPSRPGHFEESPITLAQRKNSKLLTSEFKPGDCLVFGMFTVHGSFDNLSQTGKIRLSCDTRFQPSSDPMDERFSGANPPAHGGLGYGCLTAALPMTEAGVAR